MIEDLQKRLNNIDKLLQRRIGQRDQLVKNCNNISNSLNETNEFLSHLMEGKSLLELFVKSTEYKTRQKLEPAITEALHFIFSQELYFHLWMVTRRNQSEVDFIILRSKESELYYQQYLQQNDEKGLEQLVKETKNILFMYGGSVNQVLSLMLRLIIVELLKIKGPIILDEPTSALPEEYNSKLGQVIHQLSRRFNRQYIFITHSTSLAGYADKAYRVEQKDYLSFVREL
ncbi:MAG: hypothetical protein M0R03_10990 [Novosphingobium sp.]|nr:hypothetical protein [Novosphingobium sp.]